MRTLAFLLCTTVTHAFAPAMLFPSGGVLRRELASPRAHSPRVAFRAHPLRLRMQKSPQTVEVPDTIEVEDDLLRPAGRIASTAPEAIEAEALRLMDMPDGVVCDPRGVCVIPDDEEEIAERPFGEWGPRIMLLAVCVAYGSNFAFGHILNDAMPSSVACGLRFSLAALALAPFLPQLERRLVFPAVASSLAISAAYVGQVLSLQTVSAGKVGFICSLSVIVCPILEVLFDGRKVDKSLVWSVLLAVSGVASLELTGGDALGTGDLLAFSQPVGFGLGYWATSKLMQSDPEQAMPITAVQAATVAGVSLLWMLVAGLLNGSLIDGTLLQGAASLQAVGALLYTGILTTALTRVGETQALKGMSGTDAAVILTTEPIWAIAWASLLVGEQVGPSAVVGGALVIAACAVNFLGEAAAGDAKEKEA